MSVTLNCPEAMQSVLDVATHSATPVSTASAARPSAVQSAELMREVGLKCISFNGIPRTINMLGQAAGRWPADVAAALAGRPAARNLTPDNLAARQRAGRALWDAVYAGVSDRLLDRLRVSHPDLPVHILDGHYASLLADPPPPDQQQQSSSPPPPRVGRVLTALTAIACLRAQTGVAPQVVSHVLGLRKAYETGDADAAGEEPVQGGAWLASDDGALWLLRSVDRLVDAISGGYGAVNFTPASPAAKL